MSFAIKIIGVGKKKEILAGEGAHYAQLLNYYATITVECLRSHTGTARHGHKHTQQEENLFYTRWHPSCYPVALSEKGRLFDSMSFAQWLAERMKHGRQLVFNIGGAFGLPPPLQKKCKEVISLSPLTFPHQWCYGILIEQLYRAFTILHGHPYHK